MKLSVAKISQWIGLRLLIFGVHLYFLSWTMQMYYLKSSQSKSAWQSTALACIVYSEQSLTDHN